jgi:3D (Asp-Asp-Asp) domain-containing protein
MKNRPQQKKLKPLAPRLAKYTVDIGFALLAIFMFGNILLPAALGALPEGGSLPKKETVALMVEAMLNETRAYGRLPEALVGEPRTSLRVPVTAYSSEVWQTDSTPFITAWGTKVRDGIVAANFLPMGTRIRIPELFGDKVFIVEDRMNPRYYYHMDVWMADTGEARNFGRKYVKIEVF